MISDHISLEIATAHRKGHDPRPLPPGGILRDMMEGLGPEDRKKILDSYLSTPALEEGTPVPGCNCPECTGIPLDHPARCLRVPRHDGDMDRLVEDARARPILEVARGLGLEPKRMGKEWTCSCPLHADSTPSLFLNPDKGVWTCFSCGKGGDALSLVMQVKRIGFLEAVRWAA